MSAVRDSHDLLNSHGLGARFGGRGGAGDRNCDARFTPERKA